MIGDAHDYQTLLSHSVEMVVGEGVKVRVVDLETLIRTKEYAGADKDKAILPLLRQTLKGKNR